MRAIYHPRDEVGLNYINFVFHPRDEVGPQRVGYYATVPTRSGHGIAEVKLVNPQNLANTLQFILRTKKT